MVPSRLICCACHSLYRQIGGDPEWWEHEQIQEPEPEPFFHHPRRESVLVKITMFLVVAVYSVPLDDRLKRSARRLPVACSPCSRMVDWTTDSRLEKFGCV